MSDVSFETLSPLQQAYYLLKRAQSKVEELEKERSEPIAIIGMGCRFPGGANRPEQFWHLLEKGYEGIVEIPKERWNIDDFYDPDPDAPGKMYVRFAALLNVTIDQFDAPFFGISPREAEFMDTQQRLFLEVAWEALENAGINPKSLSGSLTAVFIRDMTHGSSDLLTQFLPQEEINLYIGTGNSINSLPAHLSYFLKYKALAWRLIQLAPSSLVALPIRPATVCFLMRVIYASLEGSI